MPTHIARLSAIATKPNHGKGPRELVVRCKELNPTRDRRDSRFSSKFNQIVFETVTQSGDGTYITPLQVTGLIKDLQKMGFEDGATLIELVKTIATGEKIDDKHYFMERLIKLASALPLTSKNGTMITTSLVTKLWSDLPHPPSTLLGEEYNYRRADGSYNVMHSVLSHLGSLEKLTAFSERCTALYWSSSYSLCQDRQTCDNYTILPSRPSHHI